MLSPHNAFPLEPQSERLSDARPLRTWKIMVQGHTRPEAPPVTLRASSHTYTNHSHPARKAIQSAKLGAHVQSHESQNRNSLSGFDLPDGVKRKMGKLSRTVK